MILDINRTKKNHLKNFYVQIFKKKTPNFIPDCCFKPYKSNHAHTNTQIYKTHQKLENISVF